MIHFFLLGIINSKLFSYLYINTSSISTKDDFRQTTLAELRKMPIPKYEENNKQCKKLINLVQQLLDVNFENKIIRTEYDKNLFKQKIDILDNQIDRLVYELYGLTEEGIRIVEGENN